MTFTSKVFSNNIISSLICAAKTGTMASRLCAGVLYNNNNNLVTKAVNQNRSCLRRTSSCSLHAEIAALGLYHGRNLSFYKNKWCILGKNPKINVIVIRIDSNDKLKFSRPCSKCVKFMQDIKVNKVFYSTGNSDEMVGEKIKNMISNHVSFGNKVTDHVRKTGNINVSYNPHKLLDHWFSTVPKLFTYQNKKYFIKLLHMDLISSYPNSTVTVNNEHDNRYYFGMVDENKNIKYETTFILQRQ